MSAVRPPWPPNTACCLALDVSSVSYSRSPSLAAARTDATRSSPDLRSRSPSSLTFLVLLMRSVMSMSRENRSFNSDPESMASSSGALSTCFTLGYVAKSGLAPGVLRSSHCMNPSSFAFALHPGSVQNLRLLSLASVSDAPFCFTTHSTRSLQLNGMSLHWHIPQKSSIMSARGRFFGSSFRCGRLALASRLSFNGSRPPPARRLAETALVLSSCSSLWPLLSKDTMTA
mmetsp:Transcript_21051/g.46773  ORF Transcript_21051/g.46773 Transcript_21051/m.46773 type:complete len:230 (+) Transcript_21051:731-1420(+)